MNCIKLEGTTNNLTFDSNLHFAVKSLWMFEDLHEVLTDSDTFILEPEGDNFILLHKSLKLEKTTPILVFPSSVKIKQLHQAIYFYFKEAYAEYFI